ncbi:MAG: RNA polymerase sigma factor [Ilumatobacteraceae bacterium]
MNLPRSDAELLRALFEAHFADLWRFARRRSSSASDADDITAQVFAVAWRRRNEVPPSSQVRLWLFGVARNVLSNHRRAVERQRRLQLRLVENFRGDPHADEPDSSDSGLQDALASLSEMDREVVMMRCWDGLAVSEIAVLLECTPNAVSVRLHKARRRLADLLADRTDPSGGGHVPVDSKPPRTGGCHDHR